MSNELITSRPRPMYGKVTLGGVLNSERIRFFSLNSTRILILVSFVLYVGIAAVGMWGTGSFLQEMANMPDAGQIPGTENMGSKDFTAEVLASGLMLSQLILGVLGVLLISGEFTTGSAVSTFLASPQRLRVLSAKVILITLVSGIVQVLATLAAYLVCLPIADKYNMTLEFGSEAFQRVLWYGALNAVMAALLGLSLGLLLRNSAGGITALAAIFFVLPIIAQILVATTDWFKDYISYLPDQLGAALAMPLSSTSELEMWQLWLGVAGWVLIPLILGAVLLKTRDIK